MKSVILLIQLQEKLNAYNNIELIILQRNPTAECAYEMKAKAKI